MRSKVAKRLRRTALLFAGKTKDTKYKQDTRKRKDGCRIDTIMIDTSCTRAVYKKLKKRYKDEH